MSAQPPLKARLRIVTLEALMTEDQVAEILGIPGSLIRKWREKGSRMDDSSPTPSAPPAAQKPLPPFLRESQAPVPKLLYTKKEAAYALGVSVRTIERLLASKAFRTHYNGNKVLIPASDVRRAAKFENLANVTPITSVK